jgi:hypothetical protein
MIEMVLIFYGFVLIRTLMCAVEKGFILPELHVIDKVLQSLKLFHLRELLIN